MTYMRLLGEGVGPICRDRRVGPPGWWVFGGMGDLYVPTVGAGVKKMRVVWTVFGAAFGSGVAPTETRVCSYGRVGSQGYALRKPSVGVGIGVGGMHGWGHPLGLCSCGPRMQSW